MISGKYKHYKGGEYEVLFVARHTETEEEMVVYKSTTEKKVWVRPLVMWQENVEVGGQQIKRFTKID